MTRDTFDMFTNNDDRGRFGDNEIRGNDSIRSNLIELTVCLHHETPLAVLVSIDGVEARANWIPKSWIEIDHKSATTRGHRKNGQVVELAIITITLPADAGGREAPRLNQGAMRHETDHRCAA